MVPVTSCSNDFCRNAASEQAARGVASGFWSMAVAIVNLNGWQCLIFTISVCLNKSCGYHSMYGCGAGCILLCDGCV